MNCLSFVRHQVINWAAVDLLSDETTGINLKTESKLTVALRKCIWMCRDIPGKPAQNNGFRCPGVGVTKPIFSVPLFSTFSVIVKTNVSYWISRLYLAEVSPQLSCGDTCRIWMWFRESNRNFCKIENFAYGEISERSFSNPHPWPLVSQGHQQQRYWIGRKKGHYLLPRRISIPCTIYRQNSSICGTKFQNLNVSRLVFQLSLLNPLKPCV